MTPFDSPERNLGGDLRGLADLPVAELLVGERLPRELQGDRAGGIRSRVLVRKREQLVGESIGRGEGGRVQISVLDVLRPIFR